MELHLRILLSIGMVLAVIVNAICNWILPRKNPSYPPIKNTLLTKSMSELVADFCQRKVTSEQVVTAYIERIKEVNQSLNAVIEDRFADALKDAKHADTLMANTPNGNMVALFARYPLLGIPFTVKESCGLKGLSYVVGNVHRMNQKCSQNGEVVELLRSAGCIPLLVSANPELCMSFETSTHTHGRCRNPYDLRRTSAGSSSGEGALNGSGATIFGLGSDIAGSIRLPALFCGVFGHKPTGGLTSIAGHYPFAHDSVFKQQLQLGPITRFARDLPILLKIMAGKNAEKLKFSEFVPTKEIKIHYACGFDGLNGLVHAPVAFDIKLAIMKAVKYLEKSGLSTEAIEMKNFRNSVEIVLAGLVSNKGIPSITLQSSINTPTVKVSFSEILKSLIGHSIYTKDALIMEYARNNNGFMKEEILAKLHAETEHLRAELKKLLGTNGVLFFPTFHSPATCFNLSILNLVGVDFMAIFNILGFPATHIPMGLDHRTGMPVGFQVIAAPYQDKLCLQIAQELESAFGGWVPPVKHEF